MNSIQISTNLQNNNNYSNFDYHKELQYYFDWMDHYNWHTYNIRDHQSFDSKLKKIFIFIYLFPFVGSLTKYNKTSYSNNWKNRHVYIISARMMVDDELTSKSMVREWKTFITNSIFFHMWRNSIINWCFFIFYTLINQRSNMIHRPLKSEQ